MSNETDLDWLARHVHVWPEGKREALVCWPRNVDTLIWSSVLSDAGWITKEQWLSRRAELQNKPRFADHPDAKCFFQHENGVWSKNIESHDMGIDVIGWRNKYQSLRADYGWIDVGKGEIIGDWRDTLEKRPEELQPFTSIEDNQEKGMKQDDGWFERGELPPVGLMCDIRLSCWNSEKYEKVTIVAITNEYLIVKYETFEQHYMLKDISFRPIRTERDVLIEMLADFDGSPASAGAVADAILAAGFSMGAK